MRALIIVDMLNDFVDGKLANPKAQAIIQLQRGEDPFAVTTQMRTLWE